MTKPTETSHLPFNVNGADVVDLLLTVFDSCPIPLVVTDQEGVHLRVNSSFATLCGYTPEELIGQSALALGLWHDQAERDTIRGTLFERGIVEDCEVVLAKKDRSTMSCLLSARLIEVEGQQQIISVIRDITARQKAQEALKTSETLFREFFMSNPVGTIITSPSGTIHMVNPAFCAASDYAEEEVLGKTSQEMGFWQNPQDREQMINAIKTRGYIDNLEAQFFGKDNRAMTCLVSCRAVVIQDELRILSTLYDITEKKKAEDALKILDQAKSDFIAMAAHELRTPLIAITGYAELLENADEHGFTNEKKKAYASTILNNAEILNRLVDDLMDVDKIQRGQTLDILRETTPTEALIRNAIDPVAHRSHDHRFQVQHATPLPQTLWVDKARIIQVLHNLLNNAIKYSPGGGVIEIITETRDDEIAVSVKDQGMGMNQEQQAQVFDKFYRANPKESMSGGLGLGMSIVKQIVEDHGGQITLESEPGRGTTVTFTLPTRAC